MRIRLTVHLVGEGVSFPIGAIVIVPEQMPAVTARRLIETGQAIEVKRTMRREKAVMHE